MRSFIIFLVLGAIAYVECASAYDTKDNDVIVVNRADDFYQYLLALRLAQLQSQYATASTTVKVDCQPVGGFCTYHEDCCSFACLGYLKRCVSG